MAGWTHPDPDRGYLRAPGDEGWKARMLALRAVVAAGEGAVVPLLAALSGPDEEQRIFAAQALGYLAPHTQLEALLDALAKDPSAGVRLYAADAIGAKRAGAAHAERLRELQEAELDRDVKKHLGYALERGADVQDPRIVRALLDWDPARMDTAVVGEPAPDFEL